MAAMKSIRDVLDAEPPEARIHSLIHAPDVAEQIAKDRDKYWKDVEQSGGYNITNDYGLYYGCGMPRGCICRVKDLSHPIFDDLARFAIEKHNKDLPEDERFSLASIEKINYERCNQYVIVYLTLKVKDACGNENTCRATVLNCLWDCKWLKELGLAPYGSKYVVRGSSSGQAETTQDIGKQQRVEAIRKKLSKMSPAEKILYGRLLKKKRDKAAKGTKIETAKEQERTGFVKVYELLGAMCKHVETGIYPLSSDEYERMLHHQSQLTVRGKTS